MNIKGSKILITGGAGLVGSHIADLLVREGAARIVVLDNLLRGRRENLAWAERHGGVEFVEGDIRDAALVAGLCKGMDAVFHQAAIRITRCNDSPREALEVMIDGSFNVIEAAAEHRVEKIVAASSASVYGDADYFPTDEKHPLNNRTLYGAGKIALEQLLSAFHELYGLPYAALRYFNVYGPRMDVHGAYTEVMVRFLDRIDAGERPVLHGDGSQTMDFIYVEDVARANLAALKSDAACGTYNVGTGVSTSLNEMAAIVLRLAASPLEPLYQGKPHLVTRRQASTEKAERELGFKYSVPLDEGLRRLIEWRMQEKTSKGK